MSMQTSAPRLRFLLGACQILLLLTAVVHVSSESPNHSRLNRFYEVTNGKHWKNNTHWNTTKPICSWFGVVCSSSKEVVGLVLPSNGLVGRIAKVTYEITSLQTLNLKKNSLTDAGFQGLTKDDSKIETIDLSENGLTSVQGVENAPNSLRELHLGENRLKSFPKEVTQLHKLRNLFIAKNKLKGQLPTQIGRMTELKHLNAYGNSLSGALPSEIGLLTKLELFSLAENAFTGTIPTTVNHMKSLVTFSLHNHVDRKGELTGTLPRFSDIPDIKEVYLEGNSLTGSIPHKFLEHATTTNYMHIGLSHNKLTGIPSELERFSSMQLNVVDNQFTHIPKRFCTFGKWMAGAVEQYGCDAILCPNATYNKEGRQSNDEEPCMPCAHGTGSPYLGAISCNEDGGAPIVQILFEFYTKLRGTKWKKKDGWEQFDYVTADSIDWGSIVPCTFHGIECVFNTVYGINLHNNGLKGTIPSSLFQLPHLATLDVSRNAVVMTYKGFKALGRQGLVTELNVAHTQQQNLDGIGLAESLQILDIGGLDLGAPISEELFDLTSIHEIHARASNFTGPLPTLIGNLLKLTRLDLFNNALTGSVPSELGRLSDLRLLDLAENAFTGKLSTEITSMTSLHKLRLHQTNGTLTGKLPTFDTLPNLVELLLDSNNFSGSIPSNFLAGVADKSQSISIDLSNNAIVGTVPSDLQAFDNLTIRLEGNEISAISTELCGKGNWMNGDVGRVGSCDAILCPIGTWNPYGRASDRLAALCQSCLSSVYLGSTFCGDEKDQFPEKTILDSLFKLTGGIHWKSRNNWTDSTVGICFREGISCSDSPNDNSGVTEVRLPDRGLYGRIPSSVFDLPSLRILDFSENEVDIGFSRIEKAKNLEVLRMNTTEVSSLKGIDKAPASLTELHLSNNKLSGAIPPELMKLSGVAELSLSNNYFNGTIPSIISTLSSIEVLDLSQNDLTGHIPTEIGLLKSLQRLNLNENLLSGIIVISELGRLTKLMTLSLALQENLSGPLFPFNQNPSLSDLDLRYNSISGPIPADFLSAVDPSQDITVDLTGNEITGSIPKSLDSFQRLNIYLAGNKIDSLSEDFCGAGNAAWMDGKVGELNSCDAILCPPGFTAPEGRGRQVDTDGLCLPCPGGEEEAPYFGTTVCTLSVAEQERNILILLYQLTNGSSWKKQTNWMSEKSACSWHGVKCNDDESIVALELQHNNLDSSSDVTDHIFSLQNLETLDLRGNDVSLDFNRIPLESPIQTMKLSSTGLKTLDGISSARKLRKLVVSNNYISDVLPDEVFTLTELKALYLSFNWLSGTLSTRIGRLTNLAQLYVDGNDFSGAIPSELALLSDLDNLVLSGNLFSGSIPRELGSLTSLQLFSADRISKPGARLSGRLPAFDNLPALTTLYLDHNDLSGSIPKTFLSASPLASFVFLGHNLLSGSVPSGLDSISSIYLQLEGNHISDFPDQFCNNSDWMAGDIGRVGCDAFLCPPGTASPIGRANDTVSCKDCSSSDVAEYYGSVSCDEVSSERKILLRLYQRCGGIEWHQRNGWADDDEDVCQWFGVSCHGDGSVKSIDLSANNLVNEPPWEIFELPRLESLALSSNPIDFGFGGLDKARRLTELRLDLIGLSSVKGLEQGTGLVKLHLRFNALEGAFPQEILALTNLRELDLANNRLEFQLPKLSELSRLRTLRLGGNAFSGPLPSFNDMVVLTTLDLSNNKLSGSIPTDFLDRLSSQVMLTVDLASNLLTGGLPLDMDRFENVTIYLRDNRLDHLDQIFCDNKAWNGGDVEHFGCNALLCPPGTSAGIGRQSMSTIAFPCVRCESRNIQYYGMTTCDSSAASKRTTVSMLGLVAIVAFCFL